MAKKKQISKKQPKATTKRAAKHKNLNRYHKVQSIVSQYRKQEGVDLKGENFHKVASRIYKATKDSNLKQIENNIDVIFNQFAGIEPEKPQITDLPTVNYWELDILIGNLDKDVKVDIDNSAYPEIQGFTGTAGDSLDYTYLMINEINRYLRENFDKQDRASGSNIYVPEILDDGTVKITLNQTEGQFEKEQLPQPEEPISKPTVKPTTGRTEEIEKEIQLEKEKQASTEKETERMKTQLELIKQYKELGFSNEEIRNLIKGEAGIKSKSEPKKAKKAPAKRKAKSKKTKAKKK